MLEEDMRTAKEVRPFILRIFRAMGKDHKTLIGIETVGLSYQVTRDDGHVASINRADINDFIVSGNSDTIIKAKTNIENALKQFEHPGLKNATSHPIS